MAKNSSGDSDRLPQRENKAQRQTDQDEIARAERSRATAREAEGKVGGRPGREGGDWGTGDAARDH